MLFSISVIIDKGYLFFLPDKGYLFFFNPKRSSFAERKNMQMNKTELFLIGLHLILP